MNILKYGLRKAAENPEQWRVVKNLYNSMTKSNVIRNAADGYYPEVCKTVNKWTGELSATCRSYRNAEIVHHNGVYKIAHTCNPNGTVTYETFKARSLPEVVAYFREMMPKFASEAYKPIR